MNRRYATPEAFRAALDARARKEAIASGRPLQRVLGLHVMQRFLARAIDVLGERVTVKGGMALELRLERARSTKDIDLRLEGHRDGSVSRLRARVAAVDSVDWLMFTLDDNPHDAAIDGDGVIYEGRRLRAQAYLGGKKYGSSFGVDLAVGDPMTGPREHRKATNLLDIVGAPTVECPLYPIATHVAEKVHAYTLPRARTNFRSKDLIDLALIASELTVEGAELGDALRTTFAFRRSHALPTSLPPPPEPWTARYPRERDEHGLAWATIDEVHAEAARFMDPALAGAVGAWAPAARAWRPA